VLTFNLTRKQQEVFDFLVEHQDQFDHPPTLEELCLAMGLRSRGSLHKHIQGLIEAGLVEAPKRRQRGVRLTEKALKEEQILLHSNCSLPYAGVIAAGKPIEAVENISYMFIPEELKTEKKCYVLRVKGDSMIDDGIYDGDWVVIEQRNYARNGEIVVALIENTEATLKYIQQYPHKTLLIPANKQIQTMQYLPEQVEIQGVLVGQMRSYIH
jgi:repressor LexA